MTGRKMQHLGRNPIGTENKQGKSKLKVESENRKS